MSLFFLRVIHELVFEKLTVQTMRSFNEQEKLSLRVRKNDATRQSVLTLPYSLIQYLPWFFS
ncbi:hypothetical protein CGG78_04070 [Vibrio parahaemolyticus]|nr:hypothetical protein CTT36_18445 [Vibrio parahaemolyticus]TOE43608.1 hypothetical protein CGJ43_01005 [Vibrio parahaemolyticus]TOL50112.1 hypothetical protein CGH98_11115 [Vibrio parahaemolyticus]TOO00104.1 hypothetical protein CGH45_21520 [Vibrio parahaemolyticus]TOR30149.1 hypothetical protein CGG78_04070 [Vibrio parahaemolyticus]